MKAQPTVLDDKVTEISSAAQPSRQSDFSDERIHIIEQTPSTVSSIPEPDSELSARLAYAQILSNPSQICGVLYFFKQQIEHGDPDISRIVLYPSFWDEDTPSYAYTDAMALLRLFKDQYKIGYRSFVTKDSSGEQSIERELVAHLATDDWGYDRTMYLSSPGLAINIPALDSALQASRRKSSLSRNWVSGSIEPSSNPPILLISETHRFTHRLFSSKSLILCQTVSTHPPNHYLVTPCKFPVPKCIQPL